MFRMILKPRYVSIMHVVEQLPFRKAVESMALEMSVDMVINDKC